MKIGTVLLDRDGIINEVVFREGKVSSPRTMNEFCFRGDIHDFIGKLKKKSIKLAIISNQPDIARGLLSVHDLELMNNIIRNELGIEHIFICPHDDSKRCTCRKPEFGLIIMAQDNLGFDPSNTLFVGDGWKDIEAGRRFGITTALLRTDYNETIQGDVVVNDLIELLDIVLEEKIINKDI